MDKNMELVSAAQAEDMMEDIPAGGFNYDDLDDETAGFLREKAERIRSLTTGIATSVGQELAEAQQLLANHYQGTFEAWYTSLGFKESTVYRLINRYHLVSSSNVEGLENLLEELPVSLTYAISAPSAPPELVQQVLDGDITTHAEYKRLKAQLDAEQKRAAEAERKAADSELHFTNVSAAYDRLQEVNRKHYEEMSDAQREVEDLRRQLRELESRPVDVAVEGVSDAQLEEIRSEEQRKAAALFAPQKERLEKQLQEAEDKLFELEENAPIAADVKTCWPVARDGAHTIRNVVDVFIMIACDLTYEDYKDCATLLEDALTDNLGKLRAHIERKRADAVIQEDYDYD